MRRCLVLAALLLTPCWAVADGGAIAIAIHGGAGTIDRKEMTSDRERAYRSALAAALDAGYEVLQEGGAALDAVTTAVVMLEDSPLFNAGKGAVYNHRGGHELDAAIMDGSALNAGAVAAVTRVRNPILLARAVMTESPHVLLVGEGAETLAAEQGLRLVDQEYFHTPFRKQQWEDARRAQSAVPRPAAFFSTVGAVALDRHGRLAAGTSTGGLTNKRYGRVGDVPIIGAGTYADSETCAVSATGHGEYFIRSVVAHDICAIARYQRRSLRDAAETVVMQKLVSRGGSGGIIAVDPDGEVSMPFNTDGMYRAAIDVRGRRTIAIFRE